MNEFANCMIRQAHMNGDKIVLANWKAHLSPEKTEQWLTDFGGDYKPLAGIQVILAVPSINLEKLQKKCSRMKNVHLAGQDISPFPQGGYTGAVPASWLSGLVEYVLVGHRERRRYFRETVQDVANKVREAVSAGLAPVVCLDRELLGRQIAAIETSDLDQLIAAYTPDDAESLELAGSAQSVADFAELFSERLRGCPLLYGGGVNEKNVAELISLPQLSGVMTASACLDPHNFLVLLNNAADALAVQS